MSWVRRVPARRRPERGMHVALSVSLCALWGSVAVAAPITMRITPHDFLVPPNGTQVLTVDVRDAQSNAVAGKVEWAVRPPSAGQIGAGGIFHASATPGEAVLRASLSTGGRIVTAWAHVRIGQPGATRSARSTLMVTPRLARVPANGTQLFAAQSAGASPLAGTVTWRVIPPMAGHVDARGLFTAGSSAAQCEVVAVALDSGGHAMGVGGARVMVTGTGLADAQGAGGVSARSDANFRLLPARAVLAPGESRQFSTTLNADTRATLTWSVQPASLGTISLDGTLTTNLTASGGGVVIATATLPNGLARRAAAAIQVGQGVARSLKLTPHFQKVPAGGTAEFQITGLPATAPGGTQVRWVVKPETAGTISPNGTLGLFTAGRARGQVRIEAHIAGPAGGERVLAAVVLIDDPSRQVDTTPALSVNGPASARVNQPVAYRLADGGMGSGDLNGVDVQWAVMPPTAGRIRTTGRKATIQFQPTAAGGCTITVTVALNGVTRTVAKEIMITP